MASTYSDLKIELIGTGDQSGTWGTTTNSNLGNDGLGAAIAGSADVSFSSADVTITLTDTIAAQSARNLRLNLTGTTGGARNLILGSGCQIEKPYLINNGTADTVTVKNTTGTGIAVPAGKSMWVYNNGTNVVDVTTHLTSLTLGSALPTGSGGTGSTSTTFVNLTTNVTGDLPFSNLAQGSALSVLGVTGNATADVASIAASTDNQVLRRSGTSVAFGAVNLASTDAVTGDLPFSNLAQGSALSVLGVTGNATADVASIAASTDNQVLRRSGTSVAFGTVNLASTDAVTGTLPAGNGGTGITSLGSGVATWLGTPSSANLAAAVTDETGSGALVFATSPTLVTPVLGTPTSGTLSGCTVDGTSAVGFRNIPQNEQTGSYTLVLADSGKHIYRGSGGAGTWTIPAASSVAYPIGTALTFINLSSTSVSIAITTDTMYLSSAGTTGTRTLAQYGSATAVKVSGLSSSGVWIISGSGLT